MCSCRFPTLGTPQVPESAASLALHFKASWSHHLENERKNGITWSDFKGDSHALASDFDETERSHPIDHHPTGKGLARAFDFEVKGFVFNQAYREDV